MLVWLFPLSQSAGVGTCLLSLLSCPSWNPPALPIETSRQAQAGQKI